MDEPQESSDTSEERIASAGASNTTLCVQRVIVILP
jgi:hypothetical protein